MLLAVLGFYIVGVGAIDDPLLSRGEHCSPAKKLKETFPLSYFSMTKSTKSQQGGLTPSFLRTTVRRARVSRASHAWRVRAAKGRAEVDNVVLSAISTIPRVRTYHTKKPSRFVHALSARPLKVHWRACGSSCADGMARVLFILAVRCTWGLCSSI